MIGCLPRVLEVPRVVDDTKVPRILWVKCATSAECKTIRIAVSTVKDDWAVLLKLCPEFTNQCVYLDNYLGQVKLLDLLIKMELIQTLFMLISVTHPHGYLNSYDACFTSC